MPLSGIRTRQNMSLKKTIKCIITIIEKRKCCVAHLKKQHKALNSAAIGQPGLENWNMIAIYWNLLYITTC